MKMVRIAGVMCCILMFAQVGFAADKIGVVDIQTIVNSSNAVKILKQEHSEQIAALGSIINEDLFLLI